MGSIDDIDDTPFKKENPYSKEVDEFLRDLEELIEEEHVQYGRDTLEGIKKWVEENNHVTDGQRQAVENIDQGGLKRQRRMY